MSDYVPYNYESISLYNGMHRPTAVYTWDNGTTRFFQRCLYQRFCSIWRWTMPESWQKPFFEWILYMGGYAIIFEEPDYGIIPQFGGFTGWNVFYYPTRCYVNTNLIHRDNMQIGRDCQLLRLTPDFFGICDLIHFYAEKLALASQALDMNLMNSKLANVFAANSKGEAETIKAVLDKIYAGNPSAVYEPHGKERGAAEPWSVFNRDIKAGFIAPELLDVYRSIFAEFDTEIGIPNANTRKKERLIADEVNQNNAETMSRVTVMEQNMQRDIEAVKRLYPELTLSVTLADFVLPGGDSNGQADADRTV